MDIIFYAGSLRPGGGLTVAKIMIEAMAENKSNHIVVYTGAKDSSLALQSTFEAYDNVREKPFLHSVSSEIRYVLSKLVFLPKSLLNRKTLLISVNYFIPSFYRQFVYHLNLLSFMKQKGDGFSKKIKEFDASLACRFASINVFESDYLKKKAEQYTGVNIRNPKRLYIGIDPDFYISEKLQAYTNNANILLVSSPQPHKDNQTCINALKALYEKENAISWRLTIVGGQSIEQWSELQSHVSQLGLDDKVDFLGPIDKKSLSQRFNESLCLISASKIESFCMVALEAMASECPAIVTDETSMPESVGDAAIVVKAGDAYQFAQAVVTIYHDKSVRKSMIKKGKIWAERFTYQSFSENLMKLIDPKDLGTNK